jgi:hypothetical protein
MLRDFFLGFVRIHILHHAAVSAQDPLGSEGGDR